MATEKAHRELKGWLSLSEDLRSHQWAGFGDPRPATGGVWRLAPNNRQTRAQRRNSSEKVGDGATEAGKLG
jgi:hypothetical protein